jgi:4-amino-4-deoxy-L-arabinose transferase-like glycosyltransferase
VLIQAALVLGRSLDDLNGVRLTLGMPALWRSAYFSQGEKFADYVVFLNENIPTGGRVVLPPSGYGPKLVGNTPSMQFFLSPRQVINCLDLECAANLSVDNTYLLVVDDFPGDVVTQKFGRVLMFNERWGLLQPPGAGVTGLPAQRGFSSIAEILIAAFWPVLWMVVLSLSGSFLVRALAPSGASVPTAMCLGLGYSLGLSALTAGLGLAWLSGAPLVRSTVLWTTGLLVVGCLVISLFRRRRSVSQVPPRPESFKVKLLDPWFITILLAAGLAAVIGTGKGYFSTDEILLWGAKGYGLAATGSLGHVQDWGTNTVIYPLHIPLLIAAFKILFGETLPAAKLAFSGYYLSLLLTVYSFLILSGMRRNTSGLATLILATIPLVFRHATIAYANLPLSLYLVAALLILSTYTEREDEVIQAQGAHISPSSPLLLSGLLFAAAAWTRPEGLWMVVLVLLALALLSFFRRRLPRPKGALLLLLPIVAYAVFWMILKAAAYTQPARQSNLVGNAIAHTLAGDLPLDEIAYILRSLVAGLFDLRTWGILGFVLVLLALPPFHRRASRRAGTQPLLVAGVVYLAAVVGMYILTIYDTLHDISWWVSTGMERMILPAMLFLWLGSVLRAEPLDHNENRPLSADLEDHRSI